MKKIFFGALAIVLITMAWPGKSQAQTIQILSGNTLNGAVNGTLLGAASMAITNKSDFDPLRVGLGLGTLYGIGTGAYDVSKSGGHSLIVSGAFNDGNNTSIIVLLDTFYGAAAGAIVASSMMMVANEPLVDGLQYGAGIGAWIGFGFGLFDAFVLSERMYGSETVYLGKTNGANGFLAVNFDENKSVGFISPDLISTLDANFSREFTPAVQVLNLKLSF